MADHINADGRFQSDKYPTCPAGKVPLSTRDLTAQDLLWLYAQRRRAVDAGFAADLEACLKADGFKPPRPREGWLNLFAVEAALRQSADAFNEYAAHHHGKGTDEGKAKAERNRQLAALCESALAGMDARAARWSSLAAGLRKLIPDLAEQIRRAQEKLDPSQEAALEKFTAFLRGDPA